MSRNFIHIGFPRTGTSYLQKNIFPKLTNINFTNYSELQGKTLANFIFKENTDLGIDKIKKENQNFFYSDESFVGEIFYHGLNRKLILRNIKNSINNPQILLFIRYQPDILLSLYRHYVQYGGYLRFDGLLNNSLKRGVYQCLDLDLFKYDEYINLLCEFFDKENVHIFTFEEFQNDYDGFIHRLCKVLGSPLPNVKNGKIEHGSLSDNYILKIRKLNYFLRSRMNPTGLLKVSRKKIKDFENWLPFLQEMNKEFRNQFYELHDYFLESNKNLEKIGVSLPGVYLEGRRKL